MDSDETQHPDVPEGWIEIAFMRREKYVVIEQEDGWHAYSEDNHGAFS